MTTLKNRTRIILPTFVSVIYITYENLHALFQNDFFLCVLNQETLLLSQLKVMWKKTHLFAYSKSDSLTIVVDYTNYELHPYFDWL